MKKKIIIDTDCGSDDAVALAMALSDERYEVLMITTVAGNVPLHQASKNVLTTLEYTCTYYPPVYEGCGKMLVRDWAGALDTHGSDGMGDRGYVPKRLRISEGHAVWKMLEALRESEDGEIDIITLGPLTNLALAIRLEPEAVHKAGKIVVMGSAGLGKGNVTPAAEFNIWQDAEACKIVLEEGLEDLIFVGWDACLEEAMLNREEIEEIRQSGELGKFCMDCNVTLLELNRERFGDDYLDMADPAAMAAALYPECIDACEKYYCEVDTSDGPSYGSLLVDVYRFSGKKENAYVCSRLKAGLYKDYIKKILKR